MTSVKEGAILKVSKVGLRRWHRQRLTESGGASHRDRAGEPVYRQRVSGRDNVLPSISVQTMPATQLSSITSG